MSVNLNQADCMRSAANFGYDRYFNICTGSHFDVPWGVIMWLGLSALFLLLTAIVAFVAWLEWPCFRYHRRRKAEGRS